jgi:hypothetical protein
MTNRRKLQSNQFRTKNAIWTRGDWSSWTPTYYRDQQRQAGIEYQHYGLKANGEVAFAGVTRHDHMNRAIARQIVRVWSRWALEYNSYYRIPNIPAAEIPAITRLFVFPCDSDPKQTGQNFDMEVR